LGRFKLEKSSINPNSICFLANRKNINPEQTIASQMNALNKQNEKMKELVYSLKEKDDDNQQVILK
jgi:hypothetical protein